MGLGHEGRQVAEKTLVVGTPVKKGEQEIAAPYLLVGEYLGWFVGRSALIGVD